MKLLIIFGFFQISFAAQAKLQSKVIYTVGHMNTESLMIKTYKDDAGHSAYGIFLLQNTDLKAQRVLPASQYESFGERIDQIFPKTFLAKNRNLLYPCEEALGIASDDRQDRICFDKLPVNTRKDFIAWWQSLRNVVLGK